MIAPAKPEDSVARPAKRFFVSIGVRNAGPTFPVLPGVADDIERMQALFVGQLGYEDVPLPLDLTAKDLREALTDWQKPRALGEADSIVVYYTGHAVRDGDTLFLVTRGARQVDLGKAMPASELSDLIILNERKPAKLWLILDCCSAAAVLSEGPFKRAYDAGVSLFVLAGSGTDSEAVDRLFSTTFDQMARSGQSAPGFDGFCAAMKDALSRATDSSYQVVSGTRATEAFDLLGPLGAALSSGPAAVSAGTAAAPGRRRPRRVSRRGLLIGACLLAAGAAGLSRVRRSPPSKPADMTTVDGATVVLGTDLAQAQAMFAACARQEPEQVCGPRFASSPFARQVNANRAPTTVGTFWLDTLEVSARQFAAWLSARGRNRELQARPWRFPGRLVADMQMHPLAAVGDGDDGTPYSIRCTEAWECQPAPDQAELPATHVAWYGADGYCRAQGKRLPSQAEWELAARGPETRAFPWGDTYPGACRDVAFASDLQGCPPRTRPAAVGTSPLDRTPAGIRDLGGNVTEWTSDGFTPVSPDDQDFCRSSPCRITRGGSYREGGLWLQAVVRGRFSEESVFPGVGFRCAKDMGR